LLPLQTTAFATISSRDTGRASALFNSVRHVGSSLGVAALATVLLAGTRTRAVEGIPSTALSVEGAALHGDLVGFHFAFAAAALLSLAATAAAFMLRDEDATVPVVQALEGDRATS
jgi:hypothetical protein